MKPMPKMSNCFIQNREIKLRCQHFRLIIDPSLYKTPVTVAGCDLSDDLCVIWECFIKSRNLSFVRSAVLGSAVETRGRNLKRLGEFMSEELHSERLQGTNVNFRPSSSKPEPSLTRFQAVKWRNVGLMKQSSDPFVRPSCLCSAGN